MAIPSPKLIKKLGDEGKLAEFIDESLCPEGTTEGCFVSDPERPWRGVPPQGNPSSVDQAAVLEELGALRKAGFRSLGDVAPQPVPAPVVAGGLDAKVVLFVAAVVVVALLVRKTK